MRLFDLIPPLSKRAGQMRDDLRPHLGVRCGFVDQLRQRAERVLPQLRLELNGRAIVLLHLSHDLLGGTLPRVGEDGFVSFEGDRAFRVRCGWN